MNIKCPNCGGSMMFDPESGQMRCSQCSGKLNAGLGNAELHMNESDKEAAAKGPKLEKVGNFVDMTKINPAYGAAERINYANRREREGESVDDYFKVNTGSADFEGINNDINDLTEYMEMSVYRCTSCGAQLMVNANEASTFCSFCGQPTVVFDRVSNEKKPNYVLPFKVTSTGAINLIKEKFKKGIFVPKEIREPDIDKVRGIYIPFWLYTVNIQMKANFEGKRGSGKQRHTVQFYRAGHGDYDKLTLDASRKLNDELSQRLEPYNLKELKPFDPTYMTGFYADRYDVEPEEVRFIAEKRSKEFIEKDLAATCEADNVKMINEIDQFTVIRVEYALLPAWFMTIRYNGQLHTVLVNGQTGKIVGNIPVNKKKQGFAFAIACATLGPVCGMMGESMFSHLIDTGNMFKLIATLVILACTFGITGIKKYNDFLKAKTRYRSTNLLTYVKERADMTWVR